MKSTAPIRVLRNIGCLGLLFTVTNLNGVEASKASSMAAVNEQIEALSETVHQALIQQGSGIESMTEAEIRSSIAEHLANFLESEHPIAKDFVQLEVSTNNQVTQF